MIRKAKESDIEMILKLLSEVLEIHAKIRPDIFISGKTKYTKDEILGIMEDKNKPIYVYTNLDDKVLAYAFCIIKDAPFSNTMKDIKTLFVDDFCVDEDARGSGIGKELFSYLIKEAKCLGCYNLTLNVWEGNDAKKFYEKMGMKVKETEMEIIL